MSSGLPVSTHGLVHIYRSEGHDVAALRGVDLAVTAGDSVALLGPSGSGKSTLLTLLGGLQRPSAGRIQIGDQELTRLGEGALDELRARHLGLVLQGASRNLVPYLSPLRNIEFAQHAARRAEVADLPSAGEVLDVVGLLREARTSVSRLTPGHLQLLAVAAAIASYPGLLLADEPTSQLDHEARATVLQALARIHEQLGTTVVLVTHDPDVAVAMGHTITIRDGRVGAEGRGGEDYAVVNPDGGLTLPQHVLDEIPPGTLVRLHRGDSAWELAPQLGGSEDV